MVRGLYNFFTVYTTTTGCDVITAKCTMECTLSCNTPSHALLLLGIVSSHEGTVKPVFFKGSKFHEFRSFSAGHEN